MEPNEPLNAAPQPDAAPVTTQSPAATQERPAEKPRAAVRVTQQFVVRMQRGQNEAALPPKGGKPPLRATYNAVGQLLYRVGTQAEYTCIRLGRGIRGAFRLALRAAAALLRFVGGPLLALFSSIWDDLTAPARRFASGVRHMRDAARAEAQAGGSGKRAGFAYFKNGVHAYRHLIGGALRYLMPAAALCVLVFTVQEVLGSSFSLGVSYSGDFLVFIENEGVWDSAEKMVQERVMGRASGVRASHRGPRRPHQRQRPGGQDHRGILRQDHESRGHPRERGAYRCCGGRTCGAAAFGRHTGRL